MSGHFTRSSTPPPFPRYRQAVRSDFRLFCAYCLTHEQDMNGPELFDMDHFRPRSRFPELGRNFYNHYYCCKRCNSIKSDKWPAEDVLAQGICFVDLCVSRFEDHYQLNEDQSWSPITRSAAYTIEQLRLDSPALLAFRRRVLERLPPGTG